MFHWFQRKKTLAQTEILSGLFDIHTHILPGVDDGVGSIEEALDVLDAYQAMGVKKVIFTPHVMDDYPQNDTASLRARFDEFKRSYNGGVDISLGAEYMLDNRFEKLLESDDLLPVKDNYLLLESALASFPVNFMERLEAIQKKGYFVILAHPERYFYMRKEDYKQLKEAGVLFQMNLYSITGSYGEEAERKAEWLLNSGFYNFIGTDIHSFNSHKYHIAHAKLREKDAELLRRLKDTFWTYFPEG